MPSPEKFQKVRIVSRHDHSADLWSIRVRPEERLVFQPGQYATLGVNEFGKLTERAYSIVSSPYEDELEFFIELVPIGKLTPPLFQLGVGAELHMRRQAKGRFTLDSQSGHRQHLMICTVTGVAPYLSIARSLAHDHDNGRPPGINVLILQAASRSWEFAYREELEGLAKRFSWLKYVPTISRPWEDVSWTGEVGRAEDVLRKYLDAAGMSPADTTTYLCGHPQMVENAKGILQRVGFEKAFMREEVYWFSRKEGN